MVDILQKNILNYQQKLEEKEAHQVQNIQHMQAQINKKAADITVQEENLRRKTNEVNFESPPFFL